ncbi:molecular chaperone DnaJ, partial [Rickettsiales bacterium]|nr:molecular chaperone DnaJ [Rickettsiales bacterium]
YHPDKNPGDKEAEKKFKEATAAYEVLKDPQKKAAYDQYGHDAFERGGGNSASGFNGAGAGGNGGFSDFEDIFSGFSDIFGGGGRGSRRRTEVEGSDIRYNISIDIFEAFNGTEKNIKFKVATSCEKCNGTGSKSNKAAATCGTCGGAGKVRVQQGLFIVERACHTCNGGGQIITDPCDKCHGQGRYEKNKNLAVKIPAGIDDGNRIRISGEGEAGARGGRDGDLYVFVAIKHHEFFTRDNNDIHIEIPLKMTTAALGGSVEIPTIENSKAKLTIPSGSQTNNKFRLKNKGMTILNSGGRRGDMFVKIFIETPIKLNDEQKELMEKLDQSIQDNSNPQSQSFFKKFKKIFG